MVFILSFITLNLTTWCFYNKAKYVLMLMAVDLRFLRKIIYKSLYVPVFPVVDQNWKQMCNFLNQNGRSDLFG